MAPIPANASAAMLFSFFVAMVVAPWPMCRLAGTEKVGAAADEVEFLELTTAALTHAAETAAAHPDRLGRLYRAVAGPLLRTRARLPYLILVGVATIAAGALFYTENVTVKLLPFDNKSELDVLLDLPAGANVQQTEQTLFAAARIAETMPEVRGMEAYAGMPQPFDFNGALLHSLWTLCEVACGVGRRHQKDGKISAVGARPEAESFACRARRSGLDRLVGQPR